MNPRNHRRGGPWPTILALLLLGLSARASAFTYTLHPAADTVAKQTFPNTNFGSSTSLPVRYTTTGQGEYSFLRFVLPSLQGSVTSATLTLRVTGPVQEAAVYSVNMGDPTWAETWLTWNNWTTGTTYTYLGSQFNLSQGTNFSFDVTGWLGSTNVTFAVASGADAAGQTFASREAAVVPKLTIVTSGSLSACTAQGLASELEHVLETGNLLYACDYRPDLSPSFSSWNGGSENIPLVAAAIALFDGPTIQGTNYKDWWISFFNHQASSSGTGHVNYFKGSELFSNVYDAGSTRDVMAARYWAHRYGETTLENLAGEYLRRTWYTWALGTSSVAFNTVWDDLGSTRQQVSIADPKDCPTLALASPRSKRHYESDGKRWVLAKVLGYNQNCYATATLKSTVDFLVAQFPAVSGLSSSQYNSLRALINSTTIPSDLSSVIGTIRMERDFHFLLWSDGRRATYFLGNQLNNNVAVSTGKGTVFTALYDPGTTALDLLFAGGTGNVSCIEPASRRVFVDDTSQSGCSSTHWIALPSTDPTYHYALGPSGWRSCSSLGC